MKIVNWISMSLLVLCGYRLSCFSYTCEEEYMVVHGFEKIRKLSNGI